MRSFGCSCLPRSRGGRSVTGPTPSRLFTRALAVTEKNWLAHNNLAAAFSAQGNQEEAIVQLEEALSIRPDYRDAHYNLGVALARSGRPIEAIVELEEARRIGPDSAKIRNNLAGALAATGRMDLAVEHLRQALRLDPGNVEAHFNLASASLAAGRFDEAIEHFSAVLRSSPGDAEAQAGLDTGPDATHSSSVRTELYALKSVDGTSVVGYTTTMAGFIRGLMRVVLCAAIVSLALSSVIRRLRAWFRTTGPGRRPCRRRTADT